MIDDLLESADWVLNHSEEIRNIALALAAAIGVPMIAWRTRAADRSARAALINSEVLLQRQHSETLAEACRLLESGEPATRVGGVALLSYVADRSSDDRELVSELLTRRIRARRRIGDLGSKPVPLPADIQYALVVLSHPARAWTFLDLSGSNLSGCEILNGRLEAWNLNNAYLHGATLVGSSLDRAHLEFCEFVECELLEASLESVVANDASFVNSNLSKANLAWGDFMGAVFGGTELGGANLSGANLHAADLGSARGLTASQLSRALVTPRTILPKGITREDLTKENDG